MCSGNQYIHRFPRLPLYPGMNREMNLRLFIAQHQHLSSHTEHPYLVHKVQISNDFVLLGAKMTRLHLVIYQRKVALNNIVMLMINGVGCVPFPVDLCGLTGLTEYRK